MRLVEAHDIEPIHLKGKQLYYFPTTFSTQYGKSAIILVTVSHRHDVRFLDLIPFFPVHSLQTVFIFY